MTCPPLVVQLAAEVARKACLSGKTVALLTARVAGQHEAHREADQECAHLRTEAHALAARADAAEGQLAAAHQVRPRARTSQGDSGPAQACAGQMASENQDRPLFFTSHLRSLVA